MVYVKVLTQCLLFQEIICYIYFSIAHKTRLFKIQKKQYFSFFTAMNVTCTPYKIPSIDNVCDDYNTVANMCVRE
jgi:hypothetical protein